MSRGLFHSIKIVQGETLELPFDIQHNGEFITFGDATFIGEIRNKEQIKLSEFAFSESDEDADIIVASIDASDTVTIAYGLYGFEIRMEVNSKVSTIFYGTVEISPTLVATTLATISANNGVPAQTNGMFTPIT